MVSVAQAGKDLGFGERDLELGEQAERPPVVTDGLGVPPEVVSDVTEAVQREGLALEVAELVPRQERPLAKRFGLRVIAEAWAWHQPMSFRDTACAPRLPVASEMRRACSP